jgi:Mrp family chromosome partitioning ATPase/DUF971 family protein
MLEEQHILDALRHIIDPDLGKDIVTLGFVKNIVIDGGTISFDLELTTPACPVKETFRQQCEESVGALTGVEKVNVTFSAIERTRRRDDETNTLSKVETIIAVSSCKGGVGKSTVAGRLARAMVNEGHKVGLLDADVYGPSIPTLFGLQNPQVYGRGNLIAPLEVDGLLLMSMGFLLGENPALLRGPIVSNYVQQILRQTDWGELDYLIIDMPPGTGDIQLTIVQLAELDGAIIVTTPQALSLVDVARGILMFDKVHVPVLGVVENMSWFECGKCDERHHPFGSSENSLQQRFGLPTLAELPITKGISDLAAEETPAVSTAFNDLADNVHRAIGKSRLDPTSAPQLTVKPEGVHIVFADAFEATLPMFGLRCACPCARCINEFTGEQMLQPSDVPKDVHVEGMQNLGNYAVSFQWSDSHTTGIYSWDFLRELAQATVEV